MKLTTGYEFQGYYITEYIDVIFDEMLVGLGFGKSVMAGLDNIFSALSGSEATEIIDKLNKIKHQLRERVIVQAKKLGANALIGIDFESSKLGDLIMVSMTATAVKIDKIVSPLPLTHTESIRLEEEKKKTEKALERQRLIEELRQQPNSFSKEYFLETLCEFQTTQDMIGYIEKMANEHPDIFNDDIVQKVKRSGQLERLYGKGVGKQGILKEIKAYLEL